MITAKRVRQHIRFVGTREGTRLAWTKSGRGPSLIDEAGVWSREQANGFARDHGFKG